MINVLDNTIKLKDSGPMTFYQETNSCHALEEGAVLTKLFFRSSIEALGNHFLSFFIS